MSLDSDAGMNVQHVRLPSFQYLDASGVALHQGWRRHRACVQSGSMPRHAIAVPLSASENDQTDSNLVSQGRCRRHHVLADGQVCARGSSVILVTAERDPYSSPLVLIVVRHPPGNLTSSLHDA
jgi:hypothetical protein